MKPNRKIVQIAKVCLSLSVVGTLVWYSDPASVWRQIQKTGMAVIFGGITVYCLAQFLSAMRWQWIIEAHGVRIPLRTLYASYMAGMFANNFMPTSIGGDILKTYDVYRMTKNTSLAVVSVLLERFSGLVVLVALSWLGIHMAISVPDSQVAWSWAAFNVIGVSTFLVLVRQRNFERIVTLLAKYGLARAVDRVKLCFDMFVAYKGRRTLLLKIILLSIPIQLITIGIYKVIASSIGIHLTFTAFLFSVPVITVIALLPIAYGGLGLREGATVYVLSIFGVAAEDALGLSIVFLGISYLTSLIGGLIFSFRKIRTGQMMGINEMD